MGLHFRWIALGTGGLCLALGAVWLGGTPWLLGLWEIAAPPPAQIVGRRLGALFLGIGLMFIMLRNASKSPERDAICLGMALSCLLLAILGIFDWMALRAGNAIWLAIIIEMTLSIQFWHEILNECDARTVFDIENKDQH